jgi:hypothetical protein
MDEDQTRIRAEFKTMKTTVREVLAADARSRNDDKWLIIQTLRRIGKDVRIEGSPYNDGDETSHIIWVIPVNELGTIPSFETIRRVRAEIQNVDGEYLPTDPVVLLKRKIREAVIRQYYQGQTILQEYLDLVYNVK